MFVPGLSSISTLKIIRIILHYGLVAIVDIKIKQFISILNVIKTELKIMMIELCCRKLAFKTFAFWKMHILLYILKNVVEMCPNTPENQYLRKYIITCITKFILSGIITTC